MITTLPQSGLYQQGSDIVIQCGVNTLADDILMWTEYQTSVYGAVLFTITQGGVTHNRDAKSKLEIDVQDLTTHTSYSLRIPAATLDDGGLYQCGFNKTTEERFPAIITIFG
jgi:hypothetical protein